MQGRTASVSAGDRRAPSASDEIDSSKIDSNSLQDVISYSGVDLKEEAENIMRSNDTFASSMALHMTEDFRSKPEYFFNIKASCEFNFLDS